MHLNLTRYKSSNVIKWDVIGYYGYLPALAIEKDITLKFINDGNENIYNGNYYVSIKNKHGDRVMKYTMGIAVLYAPFFFMAHSLAPTFNYVPDGYTNIYHFFIEFSGLFYLLFGLLYLRKTLLLFYSEKITALSILFIFFGTNLLYYACIESPMSHAYTFSVFSVFLYFGIQFLKNPSLKNTLIIGLTFGLLVLIRPVNILLVLPILLIGVSTISDFKNRLLFFIKNYKSTLGFGLISILVFFPQMLYWKYVSGHWLYFSYGKEKFYFNHPHIIDVLFSFRKGWIIYTPIILVALAGIWVLKKQKSNSFFIAILVSLPIYFYVVSSWWCWWYGGSFSQRAFIDIYPLLTIPLGAYLLKTDSLSRTKKYIFYSIPVGFLLLNIFQTNQYKHNFIHYDSMTYKAYKNVFLKLNGVSGDTLYLQTPNYEKALLGLDED